MLHMMTVRAYHFKVVAMIVLAISVLVVNLEDAEVRQPSSLTLSNLINK